MAVPILIGSSSDAGLITNSMTVPWGKVVVVSSVQPPMEMSVTRLSIRTAFSESRLARNDTGRRLYWRRSVSDV